MFFKRKKAAKPGLFIIYALIWIFPFTLLLKDFFKIKDLSFFLDASTLKLLGFTLLQAGISTILCFAVSIAPAYYLANRKNKITNIIDSFIIIPFFYPPISVVVAFTLIFSSAGILANIGIKLNIMYTITIIFTAHVFYNSPIFVKYLSDSLKRIPVEVLDAGEIDGAGRLKRLLLIEIPYIAPSLKRAAFLVFTFCFTSFAVILSLGGIRFSTIEVAIVSSLRNNLDFSRALSLAVVQLCVLTAINILSGTKEVNRLDYTHRPEKKLNIIFLVSGVCYLVFELSVVMTGVGASVFDFINRRFDFEALFTLFSSEFNNKYPVIKSIINSLLIAGITSFFTVAFTFLLIKYRIKHSNLFILSSLGISSTFLAMGLLYAHIILDIPFFILLISGYFFITVPIAYSFLYNHVAGLNNSILESAALAGAGKLKIFRFIEFPIMASVLLSTFLQIMAVVYGEFTIAYTMQVYDLFPISSVVNFSLNSHRLFKESAVFSSLNVLIVFGLYLLSLSIIRKKQDE